jgi:integrase
MRLPTAVTFFKESLAGDLPPQLAIDVCLHDLRHTAATWMLAAGTDVPTVARVLEHSTPSTTLNVYAHVIVGAEARAVSAIGNRLAQG